MSTQTAAAARFAATWRGRQRRGSGGSEAQRGWDRPQPWADRIPCAARLSPLLWCARDMRAESALAHGEQEKTGMFEVPPLCENESDDAPNGSYDLISSFGTYTDRKRHGSSPKKWTQNSGVNPLTTYRPKIRAFGRSCACLRRAQRRKRCAMRNTAVCYAYT